MWSNRGTVLCAALALSLLSLSAGSGLALTIAVDGNPSDWGIAPGPWGASDWVPLPGVQGVWGGTEDYRPGTNGGFVAPGYGGQLFDAEALYFTYGDAYAYFAVVTGFPPEGTQGNVAGDIALDIGADGTWDYGIETTGNRGNVRGGLYENIHWGNGLWGAATNPAEILTGSLAWAPTFSSLSYTAIGNEHYFIETAVPLDALSRSTMQPTSFQANWTMSCGNDGVRATGQLPPSPQEFQSVIPEPATCTILGSGVLALLALRARRKARQPKPTPS